MKELRRRSRNNVVTLCNQPALRRKVGEMRLDISLPFIRDCTTIFLKIAYKSHKLSESNATKMLQKPYGVHIADKGLCILIFSIC